jgi:hypothetical protein
MAHPEVTTDYTSGSSADTASFSAANPAKWIAVYGAGSIVVLDNSATPASKTYTVLGGEVIPGEWTAFTSTTCTRVRMTTTNARPAFGPSLSAVVPANLLQRYLSGGAALAAAFTAAIGTVYLINPSGATFAYTFPAITAGNDGQAIAVVNVSTGSTATVAAPTGIDNVGNSAGTATGATAAGPTGGLTKVYTANNQTKAWLVGI